MIPAPAGPERSTKNVAVRSSKPVQTGTERDIPSMRRIWWTLNVIQDIMGHKDIQITMDIYAEATQEKKQEVVTKLTGKIVIK